MRDIEKAGLAVEEIIVDRMHLVNGGGSNHYQSPAITDVASGSASSSNLGYLLGSFCTNHGPRSECTPT